MSTNETGSVQLVEKLPDGTQTVDIRIRVEVDPMWQGYDLSVARMAEVIVDTIDHEPGLFVTEESRAEVTA